MQTHSPEQKGQPVGMPAFARCLIMACHSCTLPHDEHFSKHSHQTLTWLPVVKSLGPLSPLLVGCHWRASSGCVSAIEGFLVRTTLGDSADAAAPGQETGSAPDHSHCRLHTVKVRRTSICNQSYNLCCHIAPLFLVGIVHLHDLRVKDAVAFGPATHAHISP